MRHTRACLGRAVRTACRGTSGSLARLLRPIDLFVNSERISSIRCPVVVLHGTRDWVVPCSHGRTLHKLAQHSSEPLWVGGISRQASELMNTGEAASAANCAPAAGGGALGAWDKLLLT